MQQTPGQPVAVSTLCVFRGARVCFPSLSLSLSLSHHLICLLSCSKQAVLATGHEVNISEGGLEDVQESRVATLADYH